MLLVSEASDLFSPLVARGTTTSIQAFGEDQGDVADPPVTIGKEAPPEDSSLSMLPFSPATVISSDKTESEEERPSKLMKVVTIEETVHWRIMYEGKLIREEDIRRNYCSVFM